MKPLHSHYDRLTGQERFQLILSAGVRRDAIEQDRLRRAGPYLTYSVPDHSPWAHAFETISQFVFMEMVEEATQFRAALNRYTLYGRVMKQVIDNPASTAEESDSISEQSNHETTESFLKSDQFQLEFRLLDHMLAAGCRLTQKRRGWQLFCRELKVPPFALWEQYPGYRRLRKSFRLAKVRAFTPQGFRRWMNSIRPKGVKKLTKPPMTADGTAKELDELYTSIVKQWGV